MTGAIAELNPKSEDMGGFIQYFDIDGNFLERGILLGKPPSRDNIVRIPTIHPTHGFIVNSVELITHTQLDQSVDVYKIVIGGWIEIKPMNQSSFTHTV